MRRSAALRLLAGLFAILNAVAPGLASIADARLALSAADLETVIHVEQEGERDCPPQHVDDCVVCQFLTRPFGDALRSAAAPPANLRRAAAGDDLPVAMSSARTSSTRSRAPPV